MLYPKPDEWTRWGVSDDLHQVFALHWTEIFDPETPDTWQVRTSNIKTILNEVIESARLAQQRPSHRPMLRALLDEALVVVKRDMILADRHPFVASYLEPWRNRKVDEGSLADIEHLAAVVRGNLGDYWSGGVTLLLRLLREKDSKQKKRLYDTNINLGVEAVASGHSPVYLRQTFIDTVLIESPIPFVERVERMFTALGTARLTYTCIFKVEGVKQSDEAVLPDDIEVVRGQPPSPAGSASELFFRGVAKSGISLRLNVEAADPEAARHLAEQRLGRVFAGLKMLSVTGDFGLKKTAPALIEGVGGTAVILGRQPLGVHYLGSYNARQVKAERLFRIQAKLPEPDASQLAAAFQYHRLALVATSDEARFVNLWIALEALCQAEDGNIIERVCNQVAPCVSVDNLRKTLVSLAVYVRELWIGGQQGERFQALFPKSKKGHLDAEELLNVLLLPEKDARIEELFALCGGHALIVNRLFRIKTTPLKDPESAGMNLEITRQNVEWQLKRIYRARNAIVHGGRGTALLQPLTQHLHSYLVKTVHSVLAGLDDQPDWTIRDALEHRRRLFDHVVASFKGKTPGPIAVRSLMHPENCLRPQAEPFAWAVTRGASAP